MASLRRGRFFVLILRFHGITKKKGRVRTVPNCNVDCPLPPPSLLTPNPASLPNIWRGAKKPKKKIKAEGEGSTPWVLDLDFVPSPEMCMSDDEVSITVGH